MHVATGLALIFSLTVTVMAPAGVSRAAGGGTALYSFGEPRVSPASAISPPPAGAQEPPGASQSQEARRELEGKALALLEEAAREARTLQLAENRVLLLAMAADLFWRHDQDRARAYFTQAGKELTEMAGLQGGDPRDQGKAYQELSRQVWQIVARRDPGLAAELLQGGGPALPQRRDTNNRAANAQQRGAGPVAPSAVNADGELGRQWGELEGLLRAGQLDDATALAAKVTPEMRLFFIQRLAMEAVRRGEADRARQIVKANITAPAQQNRIFEQIKTGERAAEASAQFRTPEERAAGLARQASAAVDNGNTDEALRLLDEARGLVTGQADNSAKLSVQLVIARAYVRVKPEASFEIVGSALEQLNQLVYAAAVLDGFISGERSFAGNEIKLRRGFVSTTLFRQFEAIIPPLSRADFDSAKALTDRLQQPELKIRARMLVAQGALL